MRQRGLHGRLEDSEILTDHHRTCPLRLECQDAEQGVVVVADVGASRGTHAVGNPPQPEEPEDVVDAEATGVPQNCPQHVAIRLIAGCRESAGMPGRLIPTLPLLIEPVGRCSDGRAGGQHVTEHPGIGTVAIDADGEIGDDPDTHARRRSRMLRRRQLLVADPLQPHVEVDAVAVPTPQSLEVSRIGCLVRPVGLVISEPFDEHTPRGETLQPLALSLSEPQKGVVATLAPRDVVDQFEHVEFRPVRLVALDSRRIEVVGEELFLQSLDPLALRLRQLVGLGDLLDPDVERIDEPTRRRQVRRCLDGWAWCRGMHRVDLHEIGAVDTARDLADFGEVGKVADPP